MHPERQWDRGLTRLPVCLYRQEVWANKKRKSRRRKTRKTEAINQSFWIGERLTLRRKEHHFHVPNGSHVGKARVIRQLRELRFIQIPFGIGNELTIS